MLNAKIMTHQKNWLSLRHACLQSAPAAEQFCDKWVRKSASRFQSHLLDRAKLAQASESCAIVVFCILAAAELGANAADQVRTPCQVPSTAATSPSPSDPLVQHGGTQCDLGKREAALTPLMPTPEVRRSVATGCGGFATTMLNAKIMRHQKNWLPCAMPVFNLRQPQNASWTNGAQVGFKISKPPPCPRQTGPGF